MKTLIVINSSNPEPQNSEQYQLEHPDEQFTVVNYEFGPSEQHADVSVLKNFRQTYKNQDYDKVVLAFQFPSHVVSPAAPGLADPLARALKHAFLDYGADMPWEVEHYTGFEFPKICDWEIDAPPTYDFGAFMAWIPENVYKVRLVPYQTYNAYQVRKVAIPRRSFWLDGNNATIRLHPGGSIETPYPKDMTDANALTHFRYRFHNFKVISGDLGLGLYALNHPEVIGVELEGQEVGLRTEMVLNARIEGVKDTHSKKIGQLYTFGRWPGGGRYKAPTVKVEAEGLESYVSGGKSIGIVVDNVEGFHAASMTVQGSMNACQHALVVSSSGENDVYRAAPDNDQDTEPYQTVKGNSSVVGHCQIDNLHIEGTDCASKGAVYVNVGDNNTVVLNQAKYHGRTGIFLVQGGGTTTFENCHWFPLDSNGPIRSRVRVPEINFHRCTGDMKLALDRGNKHGPIIKNMRKMEEYDEVDTSRVTTFQANWPQ